MGADLIGYILVTPKKIGKRAQAKAIKRLKQIHDVAKEAYETIEALGDTGVFEEETFDLLRPIVTEFENLEGDDLVDLLQHIIMLSRDPEFVSNIVNAITGEDFYDRTVMYGRYPADKKKQIFVTAFESWGDGFDSESAGWNIERAFALGIMDDLGVEAT